MNHGTGNERLTDEQRAMVEANTGLIWWQINRWRIPEERQDDAFSDAVFGLMRATQKFDPAKGYTFATYAMWWIRQAIVRGGDIYDRNSERARKRGDAIRPPLSLDVQAEDGVSADLIAVDPTDIEADVVNASSADELLARVMRRCGDDLDRAIVERINADGGRGWRHDIAAAFGVSYGTVINRFNRLQCRARHPAASGKRRAELYDTLEQGRTA